MYIKYKRNPEDILHCKMNELTKVFPHWHSGYDKTGSCDNYHILLYLSIYIRIYVFICIYMYIYCFIIMVFLFYNYMNRSTSII